MSKGIIMIETEIPKNCHHCNQPDDTGYCKWAGIFIDYRVKLDEKYSCCPIQPIPEKKYPYYAPEYDEAYIEGWNACIDELMGGSDGKETVNKG